MTNVDKELPLNDLPIDSEIYLNLDTGDAAFSNDGTFVVVDNQCKALGIGPESPVPLASENPVERIPICAPELVPKIGMVFSNLEEGISFYKNYAKVCGFVTRLGTSKSDKTVVRYKYILCNKQGESVVHGKQRRPIFRQSCTAALKLRRIATGKYEVYEFVAAHSHRLQTPTTMIHLTESRELTMIHKKMIVDNSMTNHGAVKTFRMFKEYVRGYGNVGASEEDFKNFARDVKRFFKASDAQMLIETLMRKKSVCGSFFFDFDVDEEGRLSRLFWADPICIKNNSLFGDMLSFDSTFDMNTYKMVFTPFTGVDNHKRCVSFGAGLIAHEDKESFAWLFSCYVAAMGGRYPRCVLTDQDLGIKAAVQMVFGDKTQHRFCVWHIMKKLPLRVGHHVCTDTEDGPSFMSEINAVLYGEDVEPDEFEVRWDEVLAKHKLTGHWWLVEIFGIRQSWAPAYFRDLFLGGLMRTTSRSESENSFFQNFTNRNLTLVEFWMRFNSAMDAQRWKQSKLIANSKNTDPRLVTPLALEKHAAKMYTPAIFYEFQEEWKSACYSCGVKRMDGDDITIIDHGRKKDYVLKFKSEQGDSELECSCSCKKFDRHGILCCHILLIFKDRGIKEIPQKYLLNRWSKFANSRSILDVNGALLEDCDNLDLEKNKLPTLWSELFSCVSVVEQKPEGMDELIGLLHDFKEKMVLERYSNLKEQSKNSEIEMLIGTSIPSEITILPPKQSKNKGSGKRLVSTREKSEEKAKKPPRLCACCGKLVHHDSRTCPDNPNRKIR